MMESSLETEREEFVEFVEQTVQSYEKEFIESLKELLIKSSASASQKNFFFLSTDLLSSPFIQSLIILENNQFILPTLAPPHNTFSLRSPIDLSNPSTHFIHRIHNAYYEHRYRETLHWIQRFYQTNIPFGPLGTSYHLGFKLLEIKCHKALGHEEQSVQQGMQLINKILNNHTQVNFHQNQYFLNEIVTTLSSTENLSKTMRDHLWDINLRIRSFFANIHETKQKWKLDPDFLTQISGKTIIEGIVIFYQEGIPYLKIQFPWIDSRTQIIAKLNQEELLKVIQSKTINNPNERWKKMEYALYNRNNTLLSAPYETQNKEPEVKRILNSEIPQWRIEVYKSMDDKRLAIGRRKITLLYIVTGLAVLVLFLGIITSIKGMIDEKKMVRLKTNFLSAVTHELKTPLTSIRILSELVESGKQVDQTKIKKYAHMIGRESNRLQGMIDNILNSTRLENKSITESMVRMDLVPLIKDTITLMGGNFKQSAITLKSEVPEKAIVHGDRESLRSVIQNLLDNAMKYSPKNSQVLIRCEVLKESILLQVIDNGMGIPPESLKHIFDKFYRAEDELTRQSKGTGLGLALVKQILDYHKAKVTVKSTVKKGTEFTILFPKQSLI